MAVQPARGELVMRRLTVRQIASEVGQHEVHVSRQLTGARPVSARLRDFLVLRLDKPAAELFTAAAKKTKPG